MAKTPKKELINIEVLKDLCIEVSEIFRKYDLNSFEIKLVLSELTDLTEVITKDHSEKAFEVSKMLMEKMKEFKKNQEKDK